MGTGERGGAVSWVGQQSHDHEPATVRDALDRLRRALVCRVRGHELAMGEQWNERLQPERWRHCWRCWREWRWVEAR